MQDSAADDLAPWVSRLLTELGLDIEVDIADLLDLAGVAAHQITRPAAPITTFVVGYAAGLRAGGPEVIREFSDRARALAQQKE